MTVQPITPDEAATLKGELFPDAVIASFNEAIATNYDKGSSTFTQDDVLKIMEAKGLERNQVFSNHWLLVRPIYEDFGWKVEIDRPAGDETYSTKYTFTKQKKS